MAKDPSWLRSSFHFTKFHFTEIFWFVLVKPTFGVGSRVSDLTRHRCAQRNDGTSLEPFLFQIPLFKKKEYEVTQSERATKGATLQTWILIWKKCFIQFQFVSELKKKATDTPAKGKRIYSDIKYWSLTITCFSSSFYLKHGWKILAPEQIALKDWVTKRSYHWETELQTHLLALWKPHTQKNHLPQRKPDLCSQSDMCTINLMMPLSSRG